MLCSSKPQYCKILADEGIVPNIPKITKIPNILKFRNSET